MAIDVTVLRVFTDSDGNFGNPLGVVDASTVDPDDRQRIATELGYSETIFIDLPEAGASTAHARIFTPATELPFAGHPTVGAVVVATRPRHSDQHVAGTRRHRAGHVRRTTSPRSARARSGRRSSRSTTWRPSTTLLAADPDDYPDDVEHYLWAWIDGAAGAIRSRMFASHLGVPEDEATGAAAVRITDYLSRDLDDHAGQGIGDRTPSGALRAGCGWPAASSSDGVKQID